MTSRDQIVQQPTAEGDPGPELITLSNAAKLCPGRPSASAIWRWCRRGVKSRSGRRIYLRHLRSGCRLFTSRQWLEDFRQALTDADLPHFRAADHRPKLVKASTDETQPTLFDQRDKSIEDATRILDEAGI